MVKIYKPKNDSEFLEDIAMIIFVAGFRYSVVKARWPKMKKAFLNFNTKKLSAFKEKEVEKLMKAEGMIKNRGKIEAVIKNAQFCEDIKKEHGSVLKWVSKIKRDHKKDPLFNPNLEESFQSFYRIGKQTSGWLANLHNAKNNYVEYNH